MKTNPSEDPAGDPASLKRGRGAMALTPEQQLKWEYEFKIRHWEIEFKLDDYPLTTKIVMRTEPKFIREALDYWREKMIEDIERKIYDYQRRIGG
jgi:hypothetical protein